MLAQRQHVQVARPTLKAFDQEQSLATVHHAIAGDGTATDSSWSAQSFYRQFAVALAVLPRLG